MEKTVIHRVTGRDEIQKLLSIFKGRLGSLSRGEDFTAQMSDKFSRYGVVLKLESNGETAAFSAFYCNDIDTKEAYLSMIAVRSGHDGRGLGTMILSSTEEVCRENGMTVLRLEVNKNNSTAESFYRKNGFIYTGEETENTRFMAKNISEG